MEQPHASAPHASAPDLTATLDRLEAERFWRSAQIINPCHINYWVRPVPHRDTHRREC